MADFKNRRFLIGSLILSNVLNIMVIILTIFHHFTMQNKIKKLQNL